MAQASDYNLRNRHKSQLSPNILFDLDMNKITSPIKMIPQSQPESAISQQQTNTVKNNKSSEEKEKENLDASIGSTTSSKSTNQQTTPTSKDQSPVIDMKDFQQVDIGKKLNLLMVAINKVNTSFHLKLDGITSNIAAVEMKFQNENKLIRKDIEDIKTALEDEEQGIQPRLIDAETDISDIWSRIEAIEEKNAIMQNEIDILKGTAQVHEKQINSTSSKVVDLTMRSMSNNITISGIEGDTKEENCKDKFIEFAKNKLQMLIKDEEVIVAHRMGKKIPGKLRIIVVKCKHDLRKRIFGYTKNLKGLTNETGMSYYVRPQLPEPIATAVKERQDVIRDIKQTNLNKTEQEKKIEYEVKFGTLYVEGKPRKQHIYAPTVKDIFAVDKATQSKMEKLPIQIATPIIEKQSVFTGYAVKVNNVTEIKLAYKRVKQLSPDADHLIMAYTIKQYQGYCDAGEHGAGRRLKNILEDRNATNTAVFVARDFGGITLGHKRFICIEKSARESLNLL